MARPTQNLNLTQEQSELLQNLVRRRESPHRLVQRSQIILKSAKGINNKRISQELNISHDTVSRWRQRWLEGRTELELFAGKPKELRAAMSQLLADHQRVGSPCQFSAEPVCQIIGLACEKPPSHLSHWTYEDLVREALKRGITETISKTTIGRFLKSGRPQTTPEQVLVKSRSGRRSHVSTGSQTGV